MRLTSLGWVMVILAILKLIGLINLWWWVILLPLEVQLLCALIVWIAMKFESPHDKAVRELRELTEQLQRQRRP